MHNRFDRLEDKYVSIKFIRILYNGTIRQFREDFGIHFFVVLYVAAHVLISWKVGHLPLATLRHYASSMPLLLMIILPGVFCLSRLLYVARRFRQRRSGPPYYKALSAQANASLFTSMPLWVSFIFFQASFTGIKVALPTLTGGFAYDRVQADIDALLFWGDPWRHLLAVAGSPQVLAVVEVSYNVVWHLLMMTTLFYIVTSPAARRLRKRFLIVLMATWIFCGNILAAIFISAGPAFYGSVTGDEQRFGPLLSFLDVSDTWYSAASYQDYLWDLHISGMAGFGGGISAFPSVHIGVAVVNWLFIREQSRVLGFLLGAYAFFVWISSVYLGWHYAIDGIVSAGVVVIFYKIASMSIWRCGFLRSPQKLSLRQ